MSWIRHSDSGLLAVNDFVYTTSHRVKVFHVVGSPQWKLSINPVQVTDAGLYECQVSTTPHTSHFIALNVVGELLHILRVEFHSIIRLFLYVVMLLSDFCRAENHNSGKPRHVHRGRKHHQPDLHNSSRLYAWFTHLLELWRKSKGFAKLHFKWFMCEPDPNGFFFR